MQEQNAEASECRWIVGAFVACGTSIRANGLFRKLLIGDALGAGSPHWTISASGSSAKRSAPPSGRQKRVNVFDTVRRLAGQDLCARGGQTSHTHHTSVGQHVTLRETGDNQVVRRFLAVAILVVFASLNAIDGICCPDGCTHERESTSQQQSDHAGDGSCMLCLGSIVSAGYLCSHRPVFSRLAPDTRH